MDEALTRQDNTDHCVDGVVRLWISSLLDNVLGYRAKVEEADWPHVRQQQLEPAVLSLDVVNSGM